jgi:hypothetical protein
MKVKMLTLRPIKRCLSVDITAGTPNPDNDLLLATLPALNNAKVVSLKISISSILEVCSCNSKCFAV